MTRRIPSTAPDREALQAALSAGDVVPLWTLVQQLELLDKGVPHSAPDGTPKTTARMYRTGAASLLDYASAHGLSLQTLTQDDALTWLRMLEASGKAAATVGVYLAGARALVRALLQVGLLDTDPLLPLRPRPDGRAPWEKRSAYTPVQAQDLIEALMREGQWPLLCCVLLGYDAGLRASEMVSLKWNDIDTERCLIQIGTAKRGKWRTAAMTPRLARVLGEYRLMSRSLRVWPHTSAWLRQQLRDFCTAHGLPYLGLHALRHAHASRLADAGVSVTVLATQLGHSSLQATSVYLKAPEVAAISRVLRELDDA